MSPSSLCYTLVWMGMAPQASPIGPLYLPLPHLQELWVTWLRDFQSPHCFEEYISIFISIYQDIYRLPVQYMIGMCDSDFIHSSPEGRVMKPLSKVSIQKFSTDKKPHVLSIFYPGYALITASHKPFIMNTFTK